MAYGGDHLNQNNNNLNNNLNLEKTLADPAENQSDLSLDTMADHENSKELDVDGGYGWLVVVGAFMVQFTSFGVISSCSDPEAILKLSFVGTLAIAFSYLPSPLIQVLTSNYGVQPVLIMGTILVAIGMEMSGFATEIWHLYITQGVVYGTGACCMYVNAMSITPQWFSKNRGIALGIVSGGTGIGGLVVPLIFTAINQKLGAPWTYRIMGFICLFCNVIACLLVKAKRRAEKKKLTQIIQFDVLKSSNFVLFSIGSDIALFGYFIPFFFVPSYATWLGLSDSQGSSLVSVASAANFIGRIIVGLLADYIGHLNANILFTFIAAFSSLLIWTFAYSYSVLVGFVIVYGFSCGSYFALMSNVSVNLLGMEKLPSGLSFLFIFNVISVFGSNISSAIENSVSSEPYFSYKMFAGVSFLLGGIVLLILKFRISKNPFTKI